MKRDIVKHLNEDPGCIATTMVDCYGMPAAWPGRTEANALDFEERAQSVEKALLADLNEELGRRLAPHRFVPFILMHEFEGLLFSDCRAFGKGVGRPSLEPALKAIRDQFTTPEEI